MATGFGVSLRGFPQPDWMFTFKLASGITEADVGKLVALDTTAANTVKLTADTNIIFGRLETVEDRTIEGQLVGTVALKFVDKVTITGAINVGDTVIGSATAGVGKAAVTPDPTDNQVVEVIDASTVVIVKR